MADPMLIVRTVLSLALTLGLLFFAARMARSRMAGGPRRSLGGRVPLEVVSRVGLTRNSVAAVVRAGDRVFLLASGEHGEVSLIDELDAQQFAEPEAPQRAAVKLDPATGEPIQDEARTGVGSFAHNLGLVARQRFSRS